MALHGLPPVSPNEFIVLQTTLHPSIELGVELTEDSPPAAGERAVCRRQGAGGSGGMCSEQVAPNLSVWGGV